MDWKDYKNILLCVENERNTSMFNIKIKRQYED